MQSRGRRAPREPGAVSEGLGRGGSLLLLRKKDLEDSRSRFSRARREFFLFLTRGLEELAIPHGELELPSFASDAGGRSWVERDRCGAEDQKPPLRGDPGLQKNSRPHGRS